MIAKLLTAAAVFAFTAVGAEAITLDEAVKGALARNPQLQALKLERETAGGQLQQARLPLISNPVIEGATSKKDKPVEAGSGKFTNYGVKLSQEFEIAGQRGLRIEVAEKNLSKVEFDIKDKERTLTYEVKEAFSRSLAAKERVGLSHESLRLREELLEFTRIKQQAGDVSGLEVNLAEVELGKARKDLILSQREYRETLILIQELLGDKADTDIAVEGNLSSEVLVLPQKDTVIDILARQRPDVRAASLDVDKTKSAFDLANRAIIPNVTLGGFYDRDEGRKEAGITLSLSIPLFDRKQGERKEASARHMQSVTRKAAIEKTAARELEDAWNKLSSAREEVSIFKNEIMDKSLENLDLLNLAFKEGKIGFFDVRLAQKDTIDVQFARIDSALRAHLAAYTIEKMVGGEWR